jgi:pimeloyl-ACP methyl ester carboxylesterase
LPTLIIWGAQDALIPLEAGIRMNKLIKESSLVTFDNCGHLPQEEMPARVVAEMAKFIAGYRQSQPQFSRGFTRITRI